MGKQRREWGVCVRGLILIAALCPAMTAVAQNQVVNPNFNIALPPGAAFLSAAPDPVGSGNALWTDTEDAGGAIGSSGPGQITIDVTPSAAQAASGIRQCFTFAPATAVNQANRQW